MHLLFISHCIPRSLTTHCPFVFPRSCGGCRHSDRSRCRRDVGLERDSDGACSDGPRSSARARDRRAAGFGGWSSSRAAYRPLRGGACPADAPASNAPCLLIHGLSLTVAPIIVLLRMGTQTQTTIQSFLSTKTALLKASGLIQ